MLNVLQEMFVIKVPRVFETHLYLEKCHLSTLMDEHSKKKM